VKTVRRFDVFSLARVAYLLDLLALLLVALPLGALATGFRLYAGLSRPFGPVGMAALMLVVHPLLAAGAAGVLGFLYNRVAARFGGVRVELE
jgi:hypothetical protein